MRIYVLILLLSAYLRTMAQPADENFGAIDRYALKVDASTTAGLAKALTSKYQKDMDKVRSIFRWITENISYHMPRAKFNSFAAVDDEDDDTSALKPPEERVAERVLKTRLAYCDGYAKLFKTLCDYAGIRSETISGYGRGNVFNPGPFRTNHTWNAVMIDSNWYLLDVTWASGFISLANGEFIKRLDEYYFLTPPEKFIRDHYPDDLSWTLLKDPEPIKELDKSPFFATAMVKYPVENFFPSKGTIKAGIGDTLYFQVKTTTDPALRNIASDYFYDSLATNTNESFVFLVPASIKNDVLKYEYVVTSPGDKWLHILYNNDLLLRYRIIVKENNISVVKN